MKMKGLNKELLRNTLLQELRDKPRRTPRSNYPDPKCKGNKNKDKEFTQKFINKVASYHSIGT
jgi:hypothetical protein